MRSVRNLIDGTPRSYRDRKDYAMRPRGSSKAKICTASSRLWFNDPEYQQLRKDVGAKHAKFRSYAVRTQ